MTRISDERDDSQCKVYRPFGEIVVRTKRQCLDGARWPSYMYPAREYWVDPAGRVLVGGSLPPITAPCSRLYVDEESLRMGGFELTGYRRFGREKGDTD